MNHKKEISIILFFTLLLVSVLPFIEITGKVVYESYAENISANMTVSRSDFKSPYLNNRIDFYVSYVNKSSEEHITNGNCTINFNFTSVNMTYDSESEDYNFNATIEFEKQGLYNYNITCNSSYEDSYVFVAGEINYTSSADIFLWSDYDLGTIFIAEESVKFYVNYTSIDLNESLIDGNCTLFFKLDEIEMKVNQNNKSNFIAEFNFSEPGIFNYSVVCDSEIERSYIHANNTIEIIPKCRENIIFVFETTFSTYLCYTFPGQTPASIKNLLLLDFDSEFYPYTYNNLYLDEGLENRTYSEDNEEIRWEIRSKENSQISGINYATVVLSNDIESCRLRTFTNVTYCQNPKLNITFPDIPPLKNNTIAEYNITISNIGNDNARIIEGEIISGNTNVSKILSDTEINIPELAIGESVNITIVMNVTNPGKKYLSLPFAQQYYTYFLEIPLLEYKRSDFSEMSVLSFESPEYYVNNKPILRQIPELCIEWRTTHDDLNASVIVDLDSAETIGIRYFEDKDSYDNCTNAQFNYTTDNENITIQFYNDECEMEVYVFNNWLGFASATITVRDTVNESASLNISIRAEKDTDYICNPRPDRRTGTRGGGSHQTEAYQFDKEFNIRGSEIVPYEIKENIPGRTETTTFETHELNASIELKAESSAPTLEQAMLLGYELEKLLLYQEYIRVETTYDIIGGRTRITHKTRNLDIFDRELMLKITIPKEIAENADQIIKITDFEVIEYNPVIGFNLEVPAFQEKYVQYSIGRELSEHEIAGITLEIIEDEENNRILNERLTRQIEATREVSTINQRYTRDVLRNQTTFTIDINIEQGSSLYNVSIFHEIPKCLVEWINLEMIRSENHNFEILNYDPLLVWHFDNILDAKQIQYTISTVADEDCTDEVKAMAVARDIILSRKAREDINYVNLWISVSIIPVIALILIIFGIISSKIEHEDENIKKLTDYVRKLYKKGLKKEEIKNLLVKENYPLRHIEECLHLHTTSKVHYWMHRLEIGFEEIILVLLILLNVLEFTETLPGDLSYMKIIMSIVLMCYLMYKVSITKILFGKKRMWTDILLIFAFTALSLKNIVNIARASWQDANLVLDLYSYIIYNNIIFENYLFLASVATLFILSIYLALKLDVKAPSLLTAIHITEGKAKSTKQLIIRFLAIHLVLLGFFIIIFNLMMEWFAIVIDSLITTIVVVILIFLIIKHWKVWNFEKFLEGTASASEKFYENLVSLFQYKKTIFLGITGMLILHSLTEIGTFLFPYLTGLGANERGIYFSQLSGSNMPLFSMHSESLFALQAAGTEILTRIGIAFLYVMNAIALIFMLSIPALLWFNYYKNRNLPIFETIKFKLTKSKLINSFLFSLFASSVFAFFFNPAFSLKPILGGQSIAGVNILTNQIALSMLSQTIIISIIIAAIAFLASFFYDKIISHVMLPISYFFFLHYTLMFAISVYNTSISNFMLLTSLGYFIVALYYIILGITSLLVLYFTGFMMITYLYLPSKVKILLHNVPILKKIFKDHKHHHIHYEHAHNENMHSNKEEILKEYLIKSLNSGHELFYIVEHLVEKKWNMELIKKVINEIHHENLEKNNIKKVVHYHHNKENIVKLAGWIEKCYEHHSANSIIECLIRKKWTETDIILAFHHLKDRIRIKDKDKDIINYMFYEI